jgi:hypothetical protein
VGSQTGVVNASVRQSRRGHGDRPNRCRLTRSSSAHWQRDRASRSKVRLVTSWFALCRLNVAQRNDAQPGARQHDDGVIGSRIHLDSQHDILGQRDFLRLLFQHPSPMKRATACLGSTDLRAGRRCQASGGAVRVGMVGAVDRGVLHVRQLLVEQRSSDGKPLEDKPCERAIFERPRRQ